jgi:hypothetical protein
LTEFIHAHPDTPLTQIFLNIYTKKPNSTSFEMNYIIYKMNSVIYCRMKGVKINANAQSASPRNSGSENDCDVQKMDLTQPAHDLNGPVPHTDNDSIIAIKIGLIH